jgi:hypothetical protein
MPMFAQWALQNSTPGGTGHLQDGLAHVPLDISESTRAPPFDMYRIHP